LWRGDERIQWGCVLLQRIGEATLDALPVVLSGLRSVECSAEAAPHRGAIQTVRLILGDLLTRRAVQTAVFDYLSSETAVRSYDIDPLTLRFTQRAGYDPNVTKAQQVLDARLPMSTQSRVFGDTSKHLIAHLGAGREVRLRLNGLQFPEPEQHDLARRPVAEIVVSWKELCALADELDDADRTARRNPEGWRKRLDNAVLQVSAATGLRDIDSLTLNGLTHLIGLPGAGKTTLIILLCIALARRGLRIAVFFTAMQVARDYLETLRRYLDPDGKHVALLVGRSTDTHRRHANQLAELIAADGGGGFGRWREGADLLAQSCALPAFADEWPDESEWVFGEAPCESLAEANSTGRKLCPAWSLCGRVKNQREMVGASVWLGHILSADTLVPRHTSDEQLRYFELAARTFDLIIVDEADDTQRVLDDHGALTLRLTGDASSVHTAVQQTVGLLAANRARVSDSVLRYIQYANEFERHTLRFVAEVRRLERDSPHLARAYAEKLLTTSFLLRETAREAGLVGAIDAPAQSAILDLWDTAMYAAYFERDSDGTWNKAQRYAPALQLTTEAAEAAWHRLNRSLRGYLALDHAAAAEQPIADIVELVAELIGARKPEAIASLVRLLIVVGFTVASYQRLAKFGRPLVQRGELDGDDRFFSRASSELRSIVPRSILGTFSSVRYRKAQEASGLEIDYLVLDSTPRLLLYRLHEIGGAQVLLTSATSWMEPATEYHIDRVPDYVLTPRTPQLGSMRLYFQPRQDPATKKPLRFSGSGYDREANLRAIVEQLTRRGTLGSSDVERTVRASRTPLGKPRKAALVVNSYDQVQVVVEQICLVNAELGARTRGVLREPPDVSLTGKYVLRGQVEALGPDPDIDVLVFPIGALGRGVNIVFGGDDADQGRSAIGSMFFLTRPHPAAGDLGLMLSMLSRETQRLDAEDMRTLAMEQVVATYNRRRYDAFRRVATLLARPMAASQLDDETLKAFTANLLVAVLQTIGRAMRGAMSVEVYFVDAAWAPQSAEGRSDTTRSSVLAGMQEVLVNCLNAGDPAVQAIYRATYGPFEPGFHDIDGLVIAAEAPSEVTEQLWPSPSGLEDAMDGYEPEVAPMPIADVLAAENISDDMFLGSPSGTDRGPDLEEEAAWAAYERAFATRLGTQTPNDATDSTKKAAR
jgi:hypothetical protein